MGPRRVAGRMGAVMAGGWLLALLLGTASAAPAAAEGRPIPRSQFVVSGRVEVAPGEHLDRVVIIHGPVEVRGTVRHDVVAFDGNVTVSGRVGGDVTATNGRVHVTSTGTVDGRVATDRAARLDSGASVRGGVDRIDERWASPLFVLVARGVLWLAVSLSTLGLGAVVVLVAPRGVDALTRAGREAIAPSIGWGVALSVGVPAAGIALLLSLLGLPLAVGLLAALALLYPFGYVVGALVLGGFAVGPSGNRWLALVIGWGILRVAALLPWLALYTWIAATVYGLGATAVTVWRVRNRPGGPGGATPSASMELSTPTPSSSGVR
ncbi:MAG: hypothetical protein ACXW2Y_01815 [Acidimicrobiia bacterium]